MTEFHLQPATAADGEFLYDLHRRSLGDVVEATWGPWDDGVQREFHRRWFAPDSVEIVLVQGRRAGMVQAAMADAAPFYISRARFRGGRCGGAEAPDAAGSLKGGGRKLQWAWSSGGGRGKMGAWICLSPRRTTPLRRKCSR